MVGLGPMVEFSKAQDLAKAVGTGDCRGVGYAPLAHILAAYKKHLLLQMGLDCYLPPRFLDLPTALLAIR